jgi:succinate-acetate transporter protein
MLTSERSVLCRLRRNLDPCVRREGSIWRRHYTAEQCSGVLHDQSVRRGNSSDGSANHSAVWTVFALVFLVASLPTNIVYIIIFFCVELGFLLVAASYFAVADGHTASSVALKKGGGGFCFLAGLTGW